MICFFVNRQQTSADANFNGKSCRQKHHSPCQNARFKSVINIPSVGGYNVVIVKSSLPNHDPDIGCIVVAEQPGCLNTGIYTGIFPSVNNINRNMQIVEYHTPVDKGIVVCREFNIRSANILNNSCVFRIGGFIVNAVSAV